MLALNNAQRLSVLQQMGVGWYVRKDFDDGDFIAEVCVAADTVIQEQFVAPPAGAAAPRKTAAAILTDIAVEDTVQPVSNLPPPELAQVMVTAEIEPFHWFVARAGFVNYVCDIKQSRLSPVWHAAAQELLGDIAIALGVTERLSSEYLSWPPSGGNTAIGDADLPDFLSEYLDSDGNKTLFILMGDSAQQHASSLVLKGAPSVASVTLGQLFRDHQHKKDLWQQLKPLRR